VETTRTQPVYTNQTKPTKQLAHTGDLNKREQLILDISIAKWQGRRNEAKALQIQLDKLDSLEK